MKEEETKKKKTTTKKTTAKKSEKVEKVEKAEKKPAKKEAKKVEPKKEEVVVEKVKKPRKTTKKKETKEISVETLETEHVTPDPALVKEEKVEETKVEQAKEEVKEEIKEEVKGDTDAIPAIVPDIKEEIIQDDVSDDTIAAEPLPLEMLGESSFDGRLLQLIGWNIIGFILTVITLGLGAPFAKCFILDWRFKHTKINGKRLCFDGNGLQLWGNVIKWTFFSIITLGIFLLFLPVQWNKWVVKHTHYEGNRKPKVNYSLFDGITWEYIGISLLTGFINLFSFGLLAPFCETLLYSWRINHTTYDTIDMEFDGKGFQLLGNYIKWIFFTIITLGIYGLWVPIKKIKWEVKHTHEKGYAKHPYKPVLGMVLPVILAFVALGGIIFGLTKVKKDTWIQIRDNVNDYVNGIIDESKKYDWAHVLVERVEDIFYRIDTHDCKITWEERYHRFFKPARYDKMSDNFYTGDKKQVKMAFVDLKGLDDPALIVEDDEQIRLYWLFENKIENHYFNINGNKGVIRLVTDKNGSHLAYTRNSYDDGEYCITYLEDIANYNSDCKHRNTDAGMKISDANIHYTDMNIKELNNWSSLVKYYLDHTEKESDIKIDVRDDDFDEESFKESYVHYLKNHMEDSLKVAVLDVPGIKAPVLAVFDANKSYVLSFEDKEVFVSEDLPKSSLTTIKKNTKSSDDYVLVSTDGSYRVYHFVEAYALREASKEDKELRIKKSAVSKTLKKLGYKETNNKVSLITITKEDVKELEEALDNFKVEEEKEDEEFDKLKQMKVGEFVLTYGDYDSDKDGIAGGTYSILSNGSYSFINEYTSKKGKKVVVRETGTYIVKSDESKICMTAKKGDTETSTGCFSVMSDDQFYSKENVSYWTYTEVKTQLLN